jgi:hypothetical protein
MESCGWTVKRRSNVLLSECRCYTLRIRTYFSISNHFRHRIKHRLQLLSSHSPDGLETIHYWSCWSRFRLIRYLVASESLNLHGHTVSFMSLINSSLPTANWKKLVNICSYNSMSAIMSTPFYISEALIHHNVSKCATPLETCLKSLRSWRWEVQAFSKTLANQSLIFGPI